MGLFKKEGLGTEGEQTEYAPGYPKDLRMPDGTIKRVRSAEEEMAVNQDARENYK